MASRTPPRASKPRPRTQGRRAAETSAAANTREARASAGTAAASKAKASKSSSANPATAKAPKKTAAPKDRATKAATAARPARSKPRATAAPARETTSASAKGSRAKTSAKRRPTTPAAKGAPKSTSAAIEVRASKAAAKKPAPPRKASTKKRRPPPAYLAAELGQPLDLDGEPIGAGAPQLAADGELQTYALQLWRQMQSGRNINKHVQAVERAGLNLDDVWMVGVKDTLATTSSPEEARLYRKKLLFRANLLEAILSETVSKLIEVGGEIETS